MYLPDSSQAGWSLKPRLYTQGQFNDNVFLNDRGPEEDFIKTISPGLDIGYTTPAEEIDLEYEFRHSSFTELPDPDFSAHRGRIEMEKDFGPRIRAGIRNIFIRSEDPIELGSLEMFKRPYFRIRRGLKPYMRNIVDPYMTVRFGEGQEIRLGYRNHVLRDENINLADRDQNVFNTRLLVRLNSSHSLDLFAQYQEQGYRSTVPEQIPGDFKGYDVRGKYSYFFNQITSMFVSYRCYARDFVRLSGGFTDYAVHDPKLGVECEPYEGVSLTAAVGYSFRDTADQDDREVISARIDLSIEQERVTIDGYGELGFDEDFLSPEILGFYEFWRTGIKGKFQLTEKLLIEEFCYFDWGKYRDIGRIDKLFGAQGVVSYRVLSWLLLSLEYLYLERDSNIPYRSFKNNRMFVRVTFDYELFGQ